MSLETLADGDELFLESPISRLLSGDYAGRMRYGQVAGYGDFGLGTFHALDGEMVALGGEFYQCLADGSVRRVDPELLTPFAAVKFFRPSQRFRLEGGADYPELNRFLTAHLPDPQAVHAVLVSGLFERIHVRVVHRQSEPYPPLGQITQAEFERHNVAGALVGFRFPPEAEHLGGPGYHFHFLSDDRQFGGHLLGFRGLDLEAEIDEVHRVRLAQPDTGPLSEEQARVMRAVELPH